MKTAYRLRFIPLVISAVIVIASFLNLSTASLPYQDPTAEMLQKQSEQISTFETWLMIGGVLLVVSIVFYLAVRKMYKH